MFQGDRGSPGPEGPQGMKGESYPGPQVRKGDKVFDKNNTENKTSNIYLYMIYSQGLPGLPGPPGEVGPEGQGIPGPKVFVIFQFTVNDYSVLQKVRKV